MDRELEIRLKLNKDQARRESSEFTREQMQQIQKLLDARKSADRDAERTSVESLGKVKQAHGENRSAIEASNAAIGKFAAAHLGLTSAVHIAKELSAAWRETSQAALEAAKASLEYERSIRDLAALKGTATAAAEVRPSLALALQTRLTSAEAQQFEKQFEGSIPAGLQKGNITRETANALLVQSGIMAARQHAGAATRGELAGLLPQFHKFAPGQAGVLQGLGELEAIRIGLTEGRGEDQPLTQSLLHVAGSMVKEKGGALATLPEMAALIGVTSLSAGPMMADTRTEQLMRGLRGTTAEQIATLKGTFGIKETDSLMRRLELMVPKLRAQEAGGRDVQTYLIENKMANAEQARAIAEILPNYEILQKRMAAAQAAGQGMAVMQANQAYLRSSIGQAQLAENRQLAANVLTGQRYQEAATLFGFEAAEQTQANLSTATYGGDVLRGILRGQVFSPAAAGREARVQGAAISKLRRQAIDLGVPGVLPLPQPGTLPFQMNPAEEATNLIEQIRARGGNPGTPWGTSAVEALMQQQNAILGQIRDAVRPGGPGNAQPGPELKGPPPMGRR